MFVITERTHTERYDESHIFLRPVQSFILILISQRANYQSVELQSRLTRAFHGKCQNQIKWQKFIKL